MATKRLQLFSRLDEFLTVLNLAAAELALTTVIYRAGPGYGVQLSAIPISPGDITQHGGEIPRIYLGPSGFPIDQVDPMRIDVARLGLIQVTLPVEQEAVLLLAEIAVKTDWIDDNTQERLENRELLMRFQKIKKRFMAGTCGGVVGTNISTGKHAVYNAIRYTETARDFFERGGELRQEGVRHVRFSPLPPVSAGPGGLSP